MASSRMAALFYLACTIIFTPFMIDSAGCSSAPSSGFNPARSQIPRDAEGSSSLTITNTPSSASPSVPVASESFLAITKTDNVTFTEPPVTVTSTQPPSTVTIFVSQIATFISYNATNTTSPTQTPITSTGAGSRNGTNILTDYSTLVVATATPPAPSQPAATTTKKSAGSRSAQNPIAQLVKYFKTLVPDSKPKKLTAGGKKTLGWTFWTSTTPLLLVVFISAPLMRTYYKLECRFL